MKDYEAEIYDLLVDSLTPRGIAQWLRSPSLYLNGVTPTDAIRNGQGDQAPEAAQAFNDGTYL